MRSIAVLVFLALVGCGSVQRSTRVGAMYAADDGRRVFVAVERWVSVTELLDDADGNPITRGDLESATLYEVRIPDGQVTRRHREEGWLSVYGYDPAADVVWLARAAAPARFGLDRAGAEVALPVDDLEVLAPWVAAVPALRPGRDGDVGLWDPISGRRATLRGGWPLPGLWQLDDATGLLTGCEVPDRTATSTTLVVATASLRAAFAAGAATATRTELRVPSGADLGCAVSPDGTSVVAVFLDHVTVFDVAGASAPRTIALPGPVAILGGVFAGDHTLVLPSFDDAAVVIDLATDRVRTVEPGCCTGGRRFPRTGVVTLGNGPRGLLVTAAGEALTLTSAALRFARQTGLVPWPLAPPVARAVALPGHAGAAVTAGVERDTVVVQVVDPTHTHLRVVLDDRAR